MTHNSCFISKYQNFTYLDFYLMECATTNISEGNIPNNINRWNSISLT